VFQSITYTRNLGYNATTKLYSYEFELVDSDFGKVVVGAGAVGVAVASASAVMQEYSKRNLNVAANLIRYFKYQEKKCGWSIAGQIFWAEQYQPLFTPQLKQELQKYLILQ
jgi:hypothetical protein